MNKLARWIFFILVCLSLLAPIWVFKDLLFPYVTSKAFFFRICIELALPFYVYLIISDSRLRPNLKNPISISVLAFLLINLASTFTGVNFNKSLWGNFERMGGTFYLAHLSALYFYVLALGQMQGQFLKRFLKFLLLSALIVTANGISGWLGGPLLVQDPSLPGRVSSTLGNPIYLGSFLIVPMYLALFLGRGMENKLKAGAFYILGLIFLGGIFLSATRGALVGLIGGTFIAALMYLFFAKNQKVKIYGFGLVGIFVIASVLMFTNSEKLPQGSALRRIFQLNDSNAQARLIQWKIALDGFPERPLLGTGPENYYIVANQYYNPELAKYDRSWFDKPHNYTLEILVTNGILGLLAYLAMLIFCALALYKGYKEGFYSLAEFSFMLAALLAYQIQNLTVFDTVPASLMFYAFVGFVGYIWDSSTLMEKAKKLPAAVPGLSVAGLVVSVVVIIYAIYTTQLLPLKAAKNVNYGYAYFGVDHNKGFDYYKKAIDAPYNFDSTETASKFAESVTNFARSNPKDPDFAKKTLEEATDALRYALDKEPNNPILWERLAMVYMFRGLTASRAVVDPRAEDAINEALKLAPKREEAYLTLAQIRGLEGKLDEAIKILKETMEIYPQDFGVRVQLANYLKFQGKTEEAVGLLEQALKLGYNFGSYEDMKWYIAYFVDKKDFKKAVELQEKASKIEPNNVQLFVDLAHLYVFAGEFGKARTLAANIMKFDSTRQKEMQELLDALPK